MSLRTAIISMVPLASGYSPALGLNLPWGTALTEREILGHREFLRLEQVNSSGGWRGAERLRFRR
jgi:hypothetical protein